MPAIGNKKSTVTHANDLTGFRFSDSMTPIIVKVVATYTAKKL